MNRDTANAIRQARLLVEDVSADDPLLARALADVIGALVACIGEPERRPLPTLGQRRAVTVS